MKKISCTLLAALFLFFGSTSTLAQEKKNSDFLLTTSSNEAKSAFSEGLQLNDLGDNQKARAAFEKAIQQDPQMAIAYLYLALLAPTPQEFGENLNKAKERLNGANDWEKLFYDYTETFLTDDANKRLSTAQKMVSLFPKNARAYAMLGDAYTNRNDFTHARQNYQKAVSIESSWPGGYSALANSYLFQDPRDFKKAELNATKITQLAPNNAGSFILLGDTYRAQNDLQKAHDAYSKAVLLNPESATALIKRGHALTYLGEFEKARADYQHASEIDVVPTTGLQYAAMTYLYEGEPQKALTALLDDAEKMGAMNKAAQATAAKFQLLTTAAQIAFHLGDAQKLQTIVEALQPLSDEIDNSLGAPEAKMSGQANMLFWQGAVKALNNDLAGATGKANEMKTVLEPIQNSRKLETYEALMGFISYQQKDYANAISHFQKTDMLDMYNKYWLAKAYEAAGQKDKAMAIYKDIANYNFNNIGYALVRNEVRKKM